MQRRTLLAGASGFLAASLLGNEEKSERGRRIGLGFSLYGMKSLPLADAVAACADIGYDSVELPVLADWPGDSKRFGKSERQTFAEALDKHQLHLSAVMENLPLLADEGKAATDRERLALAAEIARELMPGRTPIVETVMGGSPKSWDEVKVQMVKRLKAWAEEMSKAQVVLAVKAHVGNACRMPEQLVWLLKQVDSPWLKAAYDYSHFQLQGAELTSTLKTLLPHTVFIHVKDAEGAADKFRFLLPGEGQNSLKTDYVAYFRQLKASGYRGGVVVEVSGQIHSQPGYDPVAAARKCFAPLAKAFAEAGLR